MEQVLETIIKILSNPIFIVVVKAALMLGALLHLAAMCTWVERKGSALIQDRQGANRASIPLPGTGLRFDLAGIFNTLIADPVKALLKEDFLPRGTSQFMHCLGPFLAVFPVLVSFAVVPFGPSFVFEGQTISLQLADLNVGILYVFAMGSIAVYGVVMAGWVSNNKFSLFGALRGSAQMISYEVTMGLSIVGLIACYGSLDLNEIVAAQAGTILGVLPRWGIFLNPFNIIAFFVFFTSMMAETKRAPFDLPESESEIVAGYFTEYSGMKFLLYWLGEFAEIVVAASIVTILFFGGWQLPFYDLSQLVVDLRSFGVPIENFYLGSILGAMVFGAKVSFFCVLQIVIRWTLPRFRYDQLMNLCWKLMLPISLVNLIATVAFFLYFKG